jgi:hypothetical protein
VSAGGAERTLAVMRLAIVAWTFGCAPSADEPLPEVKGKGDTADCSLPAGPLPTQVSGNDNLEDCIPAQGNEFVAEVTLTISARGDVTAIQVPDSVPAVVAQCVREHVSAMEFLVTDPCHNETTEMELSFGRARGVDGVPGASVRHNNETQLTRSAHGQAGRGPRR